MKTTITFNEMKFIIKDFLNKNYNVIKMPKFEFNGRLGKSTMGQYWHSGIKANTIQMAKIFDDIEEAVGTLLHEVVHYALHIQKRNWDDGEYEFEKELIKYNLPTNYSRGYFTRKFKMTYDELQRVHFVTDAVEYYANIIKEQRVSQQPVEPKVEPKAKQKVANIKVKEGVKLEKTKISKMLHKFKMSNLVKGTNEYKLLTSVVKAINNTPAKNKEAIVKIYKDFLSVYIEDRFKGEENVYNLVGRGLNDVLVLINTKIDDDDDNINGMITGLRLQGQL